MRFTRKITQISALLLIIALLASPIQAFSLNDLSSTETVISETAVEEAVLTAVSDWFSANYRPFYNLRNVDLRIIRRFTAREGTRYTVAVFCETQLKAASVEELPFVQGVRAEQSHRQTISSAQNRIVSDIVSQIDFSDTYEPLSLDIVVTASTPTRGTLSLSLAYQDGMSTFLYPIDSLRLDADQMRQEGRQTAALLMDIAAQQTQTRGYASYDRIAARDYAWAWTGTNVTSCYDDGASCSILQDRRLWNNAAYPYITNLKHNDCADFVSQCLFAGGIPTESGKWQRFLDSGNGWTWTVVSSLKNYMTGKGYWDASTFAAANAGNILYWNDNSHIALITLNDSVTHRYTAHTSDRHNYQFTNTGRYDFYVIRTTP